MTNFRREKNRVYGVLKKMYEFFTGFVAPW